MHVEKIGMLGFGTVGSGVYHIITENQATIEQKAQVRLQIEKALVRNPEAMAEQYTGVTFTNKLEPIINDEEITIVVEVLGGVDFAYECVKKALSAGKHVVTANKDLIAKHGVELSQLAQEHQVYLYYEASVGGGIPVLRPLVEHVATNEVQAIYGIVNGTTNFIVTSMSEQGLSYEEALKIAQEKGFAEADPTSDVEGYDAVRKLIILTRLAFGVSADFEEVAKKGITQITAEDIQLAKQAGYQIKLLASVTAQGEGVYLEVAPYWIPQNHLLAQVAYENNAISITGDALGEILLYGKGAGSLPTATSVLSDLTAIAQANKRQATVVPFEPLQQPLKNLVNTPPLKNYALLVTTTQPAQLAQAQMVNDNQVLIRLTQVSASELATQLAVYEANNAIDRVVAYPILEVK